MFIVPEDTSCCGIRVLSGHYYFTFDGRSTSSTEVTDAFVWVVAAVDGQFDTARCGGCTIYVCGSVIPVGYILIYLQYVVREQ